MRFSFGAVYPKIFLDGLAICAAIINNVSVIRDTKKKRECCLLATSGRNGSKIVRKYHKVFSANINGVCCNFSNPVCILRVSCFSIARRKYYISGLSHNLLIDWFQNIIRLPAR